MIDTLDLVLIWQQEWWLWGWYEGAYTWPRCLAGGCRVVCDHVPSGTAPNSPQSPAYPVQYSTLTPDTPFITLETGIKAVSSASGLGLKNRLLSWMKCNLINNNFLETWQMHSPYNDRPMGTLEMGLHRYCSRVLMWRAPGGASNPILGMI